MEMPNTKPVSDLRNYSDVLHEVAVGEPVFPTEDGQEKYVLMNIRDYEKIQATNRLMCELAKGRKSGDEQGWLTREEAETKLGIVRE